MEEVTGLIEEILWDRRFVEIPEEIEGPCRCVLMRDPTVAERNVYNAERKRLLQDAIRQGNPTEQELMDQAVLVGSWTPEQELEYTSLEEHIGFLEGEMARQTLKSRQRKFKKQIDEARERLFAVREFRTQLTSHSAEYFAHEASIMKMIRTVVHSLDDLPMWPSESSFLDARQRHPLFFSFLASKLMGFGVLETKEYRKIARAMEWRVLWMSQRDNLQGLFGRPACDLTIRQTLLVYWSRVYDQVFEDPNRPDQDVIEDDDKLDDWLANKTLERKELKSGEQKKSKHKTAGDHHERIQMLDGEYVEDCTCGALEERGPGLGMSRRHDPSCLWGTWRAFSAEEKAELAERFYGRNQKRIRDLINKEMEVVADNKMMQEQDLRKKRSRMILGSQHKVTPIKRR